MSTIQTELPIFTPVPAKPTKVRDGIQGLVRSEISRHQRERRPIYHPRTCRKHLLAILSDGQWHGFVGLSRKIDMGTYGLSHIIDLLERYDHIEKREHYHGADPMFPNVRPAEYHGFQWAYRLRRAPAPESTAQTS